MHSSAALGTSTLLCGRQHPLQDFPSSRTGTVLINFTPHPPAPPVLANTIPPSGPANLTPPGTPHEWDPTGPILSRTMLFRPTHFILCH